jgi:hypothetical protein
VKLKHTTAASKPCVNLVTVSKGSFGSYHLGLISKNSFMIPTITCLAVTKLVIKFIWNSMVCHPMPNLNTYWVPCHFYGFAKMK